VHKHCDERAYAHIIYYISINYKVILTTNDDDDDGEYNGEESQCKVVTELLYGWGGWM